MEIGRGGGDPEEFEGAVDEPMLTEGEVDRTWAEVEGSGRTGPGTLPFAKLEVLVDGSTGA